MALKIGSRSRTIWYPQRIVGADPSPAVGYVVPLSAESTLSPGQTPIEAPVFMGARRPFGSVPSEITVNGGNPIGMEFEFAGVLLKLLTGASAPPILMNDGRYLHYFPWDFPGYFEQQDEFPGNDGVTAVTRLTDCMLNTVKLAYAVAGPAQFDTTAMGTGAEVTSDDMTADLGGTKNDYGYAGVSYFNGYAILDNVKLASVTAFDLTLGNDVQRLGLAFNEGIGEIYDGIPVSEGNLSLKMENLGYYNKAVSQLYFLLECMWANGGLSTADKFFLAQMPQAKFFRKRPGAGGKQAKQVGQPFRIEIPDLTADGDNAMAPFMFSAKGPFTIPPATDNTVDIVVDGGSPITKTLTAGSRTAAQIVADLGSIAGATADVWPSNVSGIGSRIRIRSNTKGVNGSIAISAGLSRDALGFMDNNDAGYAPAHAHLFLLNAHSTQY